jgi:hypothetical protein
MTLKLYEISRQLYDIHIDADRDTSLSFLPMGRNGLELVSIIHFCNSNCFSMLHVVTPLYLTVSRIIVLYRVQNIAHFRFNL